MIRQVLGVGPEDLCEQTITDLVGEHREEGPQFELKGSFPDKNKYLQFARGIAAFANAAGGVVVYGVAEKNHRADHSTPVQDLAENTSRLDKILSANVAPRIPTLRFRDLRERSRAATMRD